MITVILTDQLGNMMFEYAAVKTIAQKKGYNFRYFRAHNRLINSSDAVYGNELNSIFPIPVEEQITSLPHGCDEYHELPPAQRNFPGYPQSVYENIQDNSIIRGFFITPDIIADNMENVRKWFTLPQPPIDKARQFLTPYHSQGKKICVVHFRVGKDYLHLGYKLHKSYWQRAAKTVLEQHPDVQFVCVYDKFTTEVSSFIQQFPSVKYHGSLVDDISMITQADINIVCNSSFSIMGALLNPTCIMAVCPSIYPTPAGNLPDNTFAANWIRISNTRRNGLSRTLWFFRRIIKSLLPIEHLKRWINKSNA